MIDRQDKARLLCEGARYFDRQGNPGAAAACRRAADRIEGGEMASARADDEPPSALLDRVVRARIERVMAETEALCVLAMRAYGLPASELVLVRQRTETGERIWVEPKGRR